MKGYQTPLKEKSRWSDLANRKLKESQLKKPQKISKKSLNCAFSSVSEDVSSTESSDVSVITQFPDVNRNSNIADSFETFTSTDLTPSSKLTTIKHVESHNDYVESHDLTKSDGGSNFGTLDFQLMANVLRQARSQVSNLVDADTQTKRLMEALIITIVDGFYALPQERDRQTEHVSFKFRITFLCLLLCILAVALIFVLSSGVHSSFTGPLPT